jgi:hypothetical protein
MLPDKISRWLEYEELLLPLLIPLRAVHFLYRGRIAIFSSNYDSQYNRFFLYQKVGFFLFHHYSQYSAAAANVTNANVILCRKASTPPLISDNFYKKCMIRRLDTGFLLGRYMCPNTVDEKPCGTLVCIT